jgi:MoaA/NifB/PqqE/SkfB family radical SAM enzyme
VIAPAEIIRRRLTAATHRVFSLPVLILMPHSRCNCRCAMCDIWKANQERRELSRADLAPHLSGLRGLHVRWVVLSGGEALLHTNLWTLCALIREELGARITLLSTGLLLARHAPEVVRWCDEVTVSLDGSRMVHDRIRGVPNAYDRLGEGVAAIKALQPDFRVTARCVVQRQNYADLPNVVAAAHQLGLDQLSFLAVDISSTAFNRPDGWDRERGAEVALSGEETEALEAVVEALIEVSARDFASGFIAESPAKLRRLPRYFRALNGQGAFPATVCNAPWVSAVVEADGSVRPCFFHRTIGSIHDAPLAGILNAPEAIAFRRSLDVTEDPVCRRCVCTLKLGLTARV